MKTVNELFLAARKMQKEGCSNEAIGEMLLNEGMRDLGTGWFFENFHHFNNGMKHFRDVDTIVVYTGKTKNCGGAFGYLYRSYHF